MEETRAANETTQKQEENVSRENRTEEIEVLVNKITEEMKALDPPLTLECCISRIPNTLRQRNEAAYSPHFISIGPFHNGERELESMEKLKLRYLESFCQRVPEADWLLGGYVEYLKNSEDKIRRRYAEPVKPESDEFVKMILLDSCFIFEYFLRVMFDDWSEEDKILLTPWHRAHISVDLTLLENQIPFFVLEELYAKAPMVKKNLSGEALGASPTFLELAWYYFFHSLELIPTNQDVVQRVKHFTDLTRLFCLLPTDEQLSPSGTQKMEKAVHIPRASVLHEAGVKFRVEKQECLLHLRFENGVLKMSPFEMYDETEILIRNVMAFEQFHCPRENYVTQYIVLLDFLINTSKDVDVLEKQDIIKNGLGDSDAVAAMVNNLCTNIILLGMNCHYHKLCGELKDFYGRPWHRWKAALKRDYFSTPWKIAGSITAISIIILAFIQTMCSVISLK